MTDLRKAAEMALKVLEADEAYIMCAGGSGDHQREAAKALRQALDYPTPEQIALAQQIRPKGKSRIGQALAKPEQEPVCFIRETAWSYEIAPWDNPKGFPVYTAPPKREWVGLTEDERVLFFTKCQNKFWDWDDAVDIEAFIRAIEAKLKEKNT